MKKWIYVILGCLLVCPLHLQAENQSSAVIVTEANFKQEVLQKKGLVLVDFWATWCKPCLKLQPILNELLPKYAGQITLGSVDFDQSRQLVNYYQVSSIPTIIFFKDGVPVDRIVGLRYKEELEYKIKSLL